MRTSRNLSDNKICGIRMNNDAGKRKGEAKLFQVWILPDSVIRADLNEVTIPNQLVDFCQVKEKRCDWRWGAIFYYTKAEFDLARNPGK